MWLKVKQSKPQKLFPSAFFLGWDRTEKEGVIPFIFTGRMLNWRSSPGAVVAARNSQGYFWAWLFVPFLESEGCTNPQIPQTPVLRSVVDKENLRLWIWGNVRGQNSTSRYLCIPRSEKNKEKYSNKFSHSSEWLNRGGEDWCFSGLISWRIEVAGIILSSS